MFFRNILPDECSLVGDLCNCKPFWLSLCCSSFFFFFFSQNVIGFSECKLEMKGLANSEPLNSNNVAGRAVCGRAGPVLVALLLQLLVTMLHT